MPRYQRQHPLIVDPAGVAPGIGPRPMGTTPDGRRRWTANASVEQARLKVDAEPDNPLYRLGEALVALSDAMSRYRWRHFVSVQRIIGLKPGTGGSAGVGWLQQVTSHRFFPELGSIRTML